MDGRKFPVGDWRPFFIGDEIFYTIRSTATVPVHDPKKTNEKKGQTLWT